MKSSCVPPHAAISRMSPCFISFGGASLRAAAALSPHRGFCQVPSMAHKCRDLHLYEGSQIYQTSVQLCRSCFRLPRPRFVSDVLVPLAASLPWSIHVHPACSWWAEGRGVEKWQTNCKLQRQRPPGRAIHGLLVESFCHHEAKQPPAGADGVTHSSDARCGSVSH